MHIKKSCWKTRRYTSKFWFSPTCDCEVEIFLDGEVAPPAEVAPRERGLRKADRKQPLFHSLLGGFAYPSRIHIQRKHQQILKLMNIIIFKKLEMRNTEGLRLMLGFWFGPNALFLGFESKIHQASWFWGDFWGIHCSLCSLSTGPTWKT